MSIANPLPKVQTQKQFMDTLATMAAPPKTEVSENGDLRGHPTWLKTYLIECNSELFPQFQFDYINTEITNTGLDHIKIVTMKENQSGDLGRVAQFYLDKSDERFLVLHTHDRAKETHPFVNKLIHSSDYEFDSAWLSTTMLESIANRTGNKKYGINTNYVDIFQNDSEDDDNINPNDNLQLNIGGTILSKVLELIKDDKEVQRTVGYEKIQITRGTRNHGILDHLSFDGIFSVVRGKSIDDHVVLVDTVKEEYSKQVREVEKESIFGSKTDHKCTIEGNAFDLIFDRPVNNWNKYIDKIFDAKDPFRIWGIKSKIDDSFYKVLAVDMHTGHPFDVEITDNLIRVYLPKGTCGNVVLRLFVNLQRYFDSQIHCPQLT